MHGCFDQRLGDPRPEKCNCRYRISWDDALEYVQQGKADWIIVGWKRGFPKLGTNLVWGARPEKNRDKDEKLSSAYALKCPRVHTVEKADIERAYVNQYQQDIDRIEAWGQLSVEVIQELISEWRGDPFAGRAVCYMPDLDQRTKNRFDIR